MNRRNVSRNLRQAVRAGACLLLACAGAAAQSAKPETSVLPPAASIARIVPLVSDTCPVVHPGDNIALDWYPGFEHPGVVTGLRTLRLSFGSLSKDGVSVNTRHPLVLGWRGGGFSATNAWNGYFHFELPIARAIPPGEYHLIAADGTAATLPEYQGPGMKMTNSPVTARLCFTVVGSRQSQQQSSDVQ